MSVIVTHCSPSQQLKLAAVMESLWRQTEDEDEGGRGEGGGEEETTGTISGKSGLDFMELMKCRNFDFQKTQSETFSRLSYKKKPSSVAI